MWEPPVSPHLSSSCFSWMWSETLCRNSFWDSHSLPLRSGQPGWLCPASFTKHKSCLPLTFTSWLEVNGGPRQISLMDYWQSLFPLKTKSPHHFFLMAQGSPDQDLQIHRVRETSSRWEAKMSAIFFTRHSVALPWGLLYDHLVCEVWSVHNLKQSAAGWIILI